MRITKGCESIVNRWNIVMMGIGTEHATINTGFSEIENDIPYYSDKMINIKRLIDEAEDEYRILISETGKLKRLISYLKKYDLNLVVARVEE